MAVISLVMLCAVASFGRRTEPVDLVCRKGDHDKGDTGTDRCMADPGEAADTRVPSDSVPTSLPLVVTPSAVSVSSSSV